MKGILNIVSKSFMVTTETHAPKTWLDSYPYLIGACEIWYSVVDSFDCGLHVIDVLICAIRIHFHNI